MGKEDSLLVVSFQMISRHVLTLPAFMGNAKLTVNFIRKASQVRQHLARGSGGMPGPEAARSSSCATLRDCCSKCFRILENSCSF